MDRRKFLDELLNSIQSLKEDKFDQIRHLDGSETEDMDDLNNLQGKVDALRCKFWSEMELRQEFYGDMKVKKENGRWVLYVKSEEKDD